MNTLRKVAETVPGGVGMTILTAIAAMALFAHILYPADPFEIVGPSYVWPGRDAAFPFGTDNLGRDIGAGLFYGARVSLGIGFVAATICVSIGIVVGAAGGYFGGMIDRWLTRLTEAVQTVPSFLFLIVLVAVFGSSITTITIGIGAVSWPLVSRLTRAEVRSFKMREFVVAAEAMGFSTWRIIYHEIMPNVLPPLIVTTSVVVANAILAEAALAFVGLSDSNAISWGMMVGSGRTVIRTAWYMTAIPGLMIMITVLGVNLVGEALNDALGPNRAH